MLNKVLQIFFNFGFKIRMLIRFAYNRYSNLGLKFVHYFHIVKISNSYNNTLTFLFLLQCSTNIERYKTCNQ